MIGENFMVVNYDWSKFYYKKVQRFFLDTMQKILLQISFPLPINCEKNE